jgi:hypothetical protein
MKPKTYYQVLTTDEYQCPTIHSWSTSKVEAEKELKDAEQFWPEQDFWIEEGTEHIRHKCRGCEDPDAVEMYDAHGITTGYWCDDCYENNYPYRKDFYPTMETHGFGDRLEDDY